MLSAIIRYGYVKYRDFNDVYIELKQLRDSQNSRESLIILVIYLTKGGFKLNSYSIYYDDIIDESINDNQLTIKSIDGDEIFQFITNNNEDFHSWNDSLKNAVGILSKERNNIKRSSIPRIFVKIIEAKNLESKDFNGLSDPFCQITIGNTIRKTKTIPTQLNPKFNELFIFDYEVGVRYIEIMVFDEDLTNSPDFMGVINIPIFDLYDGDIIEDWFDLGKRTSKSSLVSGKVRVEISVFGYSGIDCTLIHLFRYIQKDIGLRLRMSNDNDSESDNYPIYFPPLEIERLEDFSGNVAISCRYFTNKLINRGILILTNCRLIYIANQRANKSNNGDLSTFIYIPQIAKLKKSGNADDSCFEIITTEGRVMTFVFENDIARKRNNMATKIAFDNNNKNARSSLLDCRNDEELEKLWDIAFDTVDFQGVSSFNRFFNRLLIQMTNRHNLRKKALTMMSPVMTKVTSICENSISFLESTASFGNSDHLSSKQYTYRELLRHGHSLQALELHLRERSSPIEKMNIISSFTKGWQVYDVYKEFARMQIPDKDWQISICNSNYEICHTYPSIVVIPKIIDDKTVKSAAAFRSKQRFPTLCWRSNDNLCTISRCSQPLVGINNHRSSNDEYLIEVIIKSSGEVNNKSDKYVIVDCRPKINAQANQAAGKGFENEAYYKGVTIDFLGIPNIHSVRQSLELLQNACCEENAWLKNLDESGWLSTINKILKGALKIVQYIDQKHISVLVHCSDGWDRTTQLTSLSQLLLDPYYRTLEGFIVLVEKEWCSFGHKFADRLAYTYLGMKDEEMSCIFLQFLDCVYQVLHQLPIAFEFNEAFLLFIAEHIQSGLFGNFLCNSEKESVELNVKKNCVSLWTVVLCCRSQYINYNYAQHQRPLIPIVCKQRLVFWYNYFFKWNNKLNEVNWIQELNDNNNNNNNNAVNDLNQPEKQTLFHEIPRELWVDDKKAENCSNSSCNKQFGFHGLYLIRKHHCRVCGCIFCSNCSDFVDVLNKKIRVCVICINRSKDNSNDDNDDKKVISTTKDIGNRFKIDESGKIFLKSSSSPSKKTNSDRSSNLFSEW